MDIADLRVTEEKRRHRQGSFGPAELNQHLRAIEKIFEREAKRATVSPDANEYIAVTFALLPLRGRGEEQ